MEDGVDYTGLSNMYIRINCIINNYRRHVLKADLILPFRL